ncbi:MAG: septum formation protein Maf [Deltaproteobacteria bacterium]|nr:septum formation protein Maf [Deltaproteobacteria bacterium]
MSIAAPTFILASASPRRKSLLEACGLTFTVEASDAHEERLAGESPRYMVERLAKLKAQDISRRNPEAWVIGCDTDVYLADQILGKPKDVEDACRLLSLIQGKTHSVWGAFALLRHADNVCEVQAHETRVTMASMSPAVIRAYVATGEPMDKAGAYAAQGICAQFIERIEGSYTNVVGLNVCAFMQALRNRGLLTDGR